MRASLASQRVSAFPVIRASRLPHYTFRGLHSVHWCCGRPAWSLSRPWRPVAPECFRQCRYLHHPLRLLPAGATVAGRDSHPLKNGAFHGAPDKARYVTFGRKKAPPENVPEGRLAGSDNPILCYLFVWSICSEGLVLGCIQQHNTKNLSLNRNNLPVRDDSSGQLQQGDMGRMVFLEPNQELAKPVEP